MKHHGPGSSLHPARESARIQARQHTLRRHTGSRHEPWRVTTDDEGELVAEHQDGTRRHLVTHDEQEDN